MCVCGSCWPWRRQGSITGIEWLVREQHVLSYRNTLGIRKMFTCKNDHLLYYWLCKGKQWSSSLCPHLESDASIPRFHVVYLTTRLNKKRELALRPASGTIPVQCWWFLSSGWCNNTDIVLSKWVPIATWRLLIRFLQLESNENTGGLGCCWFCQAVMLDVSYDVTMQKKGMGGSLGHGVARKKTSQWLTFWDRVSCEGKYQKPITRLTPHSCSKGKHTRVYITSLRKVWWFISNY